MSEIRIGIAGVGSMGANHCRILSRMRNIRFIGVYDNNNEKAKSIANQFQVLSFETYEELLENVDAVIIAVPTSFHYEITKQALNKNKHIFVEKPLVPSLHEAKELENILSGKSLVLQVGHIERFNPAIEQLYKVIDKSEIVLLESRRVGNINRNLDVDVVLDLMIHDIDIILDLVNNPIQTVSVVSNSVNNRKQPDVASVLLTFQNGVIANLTVSRISKEKVRTLTVSEIKRTIHLNYLSKELLVHENDLTQGENLTQYRLESKIEKIFVPINEPLYEEIDHFIKCIRTGTHPKVGIQEAVLALDVVMRIKQQIKDR